MRKKYSFAIHSFEKITKKTYIFDEILINKMQRSKLFVVLPRIPWPLEKGDKLRAYYFLEDYPKSMIYILFALYRKKYDKNLS